MEHEAGYDAYITGFSLLRMMAFSSKVKTVDLNDLCWVNSCQNRIYTMISIGAFIHLDGPDDSPDSSNILRVSNFPSKWRSRDIQKHFKLLGPTFVKWIDDTSCLLIVREKNQQLMQTAVDTETTLTLSFYQKSEVKRSRSEDDVADVRLKPRKKRKVERCNIS